MHSKRHDEIFLLDMLVAIDFITRNTKTISSANELVSNEVLSSAVASSLLIIGEAANHLLKSPDMQHSIPGYWRRIVDFRNMIIHEYFGIDDEEVYAIIKHKIPNLTTEIIDILKSLKQTCNLKQSFNDMRQELQQKNRSASVKYIDSISEMLQLSKNI